MLKFEIDKSNFKYIVVFFILALILIFFQINKPSYSYNSTSLENKNISISSLRINEVITSNEGAFADKKITKDILDWNDHSGVESINLINND